MSTEFRDPDNQRLRVFERNRGALLVIDDGSNLPQYSQQFQATEEQLRQLASRFAPPDHGPPRPDDMAELARLVAVELRSKYPDAREMNGCVCFTSRRPIGELFVAYPMHPHVGSDPAAIALHIQRDEIAMGAK